MRLGTQRGVYEIKSIEYHWGVGNSPVYVECEDGSTLVFRMDFEEFKMLKYCLLEDGKAQINTKAWLNIEFNGNRAESELPDYTWEPIKEPYYCPTAEED